MGFGVGDECEVTGSGNECIECERKSLRPMRGAGIWCRFGRVNSMSLSVSRVFFVWDGWVFENALSKSVSKRWR
jgi:hypothetical protein